LLTLRAARCIEQAEVVLYDRLVGKDILAMIPPRAEQIYVGKAPADDHQHRQERIYTLMIGHARAGRSVVRLKGGDPFVFGRGGEEVLKLRAAGIEAEVVPGISAAVAAPAAAGIPVTMRNVTAGFGVFAGHPGKDVTRGGVDWSAAAKVGTAVFLMGVKRLPEIVANLTEQGRSWDTPVALVEKATLPEQKVYRGTLRDIERRAQGAKSPATIVVGEVVAMAASEQLADQLTEYAIAAS
jgi:uroporphyrin-III C-methyltransferase